MAGKTQDDDEDQSLILTTRERRIQQLIRQQLQQHEHSLQGISQQLKRSALFMRVTLPTNTVYIPDGIQKTFMKISMRKRIFLIKR